jgi:hypothetical protein
LDLGLFGDREGECMGEAMKVQRYNSVAKRVMNG